MAYLPFIKDFGYYERTMDKKVSTNIAQDSFEKINTVLGSFSKLRRRSKIRLIVIGS